MEIITVSNSGGTRNWTYPLTWIGGGVPLTTDSVNFTDTSSNLIINTKYDNNNIVYYLLKKLLINGNLLF